MVAYLSSSEKGEHCWTALSGCLLLLQAGTLSGNPLAMTAGIKTLEIMDRPGVYEYLDKITGRLINGILDAGRAAGHDVCGGHINGSLLLKLEVYTPQSLQKLSHVYFLK